MARKRAERWILGFLILAASLATGFAILFSPRSVSGTDLAFLKRRPVIEFGVFPGIAGPEEYAICSWREPFAPTLARAERELAGRGWKRREGLSSAWPGVRWIGPGGVEIAIGAAQWMPGPRFGRQRSGQERNDPRWTTVYVIRPVSNDLLYKLRLIRE